MHDEAVVGHDDGAAAGEVRAPGGGRLDRVVEGGRDGGDEGIRDPGIRAAPHGAGMQFGRLPPAELYGIHQSPDMSCATSASDAPDCLTARSKATCRSTAGRSADL